MDDAVVAVAEKGAILFMECILAWQRVPHDPFTDWYDFEESGAFNPYRNTGTHVEG